jgi:serine/threonine protein kinase/tetratricopeptide (TPR) repeat protein
MTQTPYKHKNRTGENFKKKHKLKEQQNPIHLVSSPDPVEQGDSSQSDRAQTDRSRPAQFKNQPSQSDLQENAHLQTKSEKSDLRENLLWQNDLPSIDERFEVLELIGKGGMGSVYKVFDKEIKKIFAIKVMQEDLSKDQVALKRFEQEVEATCQLTHPNLVATYGHGKTANGTPYLVMEYLPGEALSDLLIREGPLEATRALRLWKQICDALAHAHESGVIHRDLKPTNVIISKSEDGTETARLVDFGIAKIITSASRETHNLTETGTVFGSPQYMSPEHCLGFKMDERSDIYSLGCMVYEMLTGNTPFSDSNAVQVVVKHINEEAQSFSADRKMDKVGKRLEGVTLKCLEKDPERRYQSIAEIVKDLDLIRDGKKPSKFIRHKKPRAEFSRGQIFAIVAGASLLTMAIWQYSGMLGDQFQRLLISGSLFLGSAAGGVAFAIASIDQIKHLLNGNRSSQTWWRTALSLSLAISCFAYLDNTIFLLTNWSLVNFLCTATHAPIWLRELTGWLPFINKVAFGSALVAGLGCLFFRESKKIPFFEFLFQHVVLSTCVLMLVCTTVPKQASGLINLVAGGVIEDRSPVLNENLLKFSLLLDPRNQRSVFSLGEAYVKRDERALADLVYEKYFVREPLKNKLAWARYNHALTFTDFQDRQLKFQELTRAIKLAPRREYYEERGMIFWERNETQDAMSDFYNATRCDPSAIGPYCKRALVCCSVRDWNNAILQLNRIASAQATNQHPETYFLRGLIYEELRDPESFKDFQRVIALAATDEHYDGFYNADKLLRLAYAYKKIGDKANYERTVNELIKSSDYDEATDRLKVLLDRANLRLDWNDHILNTEED